MRSFQKILLLLFSLIGLAFSVGMTSFMYGIPFASDAAYNFITFYPWLDIFFAGFAVFLCLCFFLLLLAALFVPHKANELIVVKDKGRLTFSRQAVESAVRSSFSDVEGINVAKVKAKLNRHPEKTKIYVKLSVNDVSKLAGLSETVQNRIESALSSSFGVAVHSIHIQIVEFNKDNKPQENKPRENKAQEAQPQENKAQEEKPQEETAEVTAISSRVE